MKKQAQLANDLKKLQYQLSYSQHMNRQLSQQLSMLCQQTGLSVKKLRGGDNIPQINYTKMLQQLYYVQPLFMAYQHKISLYQQQLQEIQQQSETIEKYAQQLVKQNDFLRKQLGRKGEFILKSQQIGVNVNFLKLDNDSLVQKNKLLVQKNSYLTQKLKQLSKQIDTLKKTQQNQLQLNRLQKQLLKQTQQKKLLQLQMIDLSSKLQITTNQLNNEKAMCKQNQRKLSQMDNDNSKWRNQVKILKQQLQTCAMTSQHVRENLQGQLETIKSQLAISQKRESELFNKTMLLESQLNDKSSKLHNLTLQSTQLQTNNNNLLQMLENYQAKVAQLNKKIKTLQQQIREQSSAYTENRKELEIAQWKLGEKLKEVDRKQKEFRKQKERLNKMWEQRLDVMRNAFEQEKDKIYDQIKGKSAISVK